MQTAQALKMRADSIASLAREINPAAFVDDENRYLQSAAHQRDQDLAIEMATQIVDSEWMCKHERQISAHTIGMLIDACKAFQRDPAYRSGTFDISAVLFWLREAEVKFRDGTFTP